MAKKQHYDATQIDVLENLEPIRKVPGMYIGDTGVDGLHHILEEVVANAVDEFMDGHVTAVGVKIDTANQIAVVIDNGRGIPVDIHKKTKLPILTAVLTKLHSGGKFGQGAYTSAVAGLHGIGIKATNALSDKLSVWTVQNGKVFSQTFEKGEPKTDVIRSDANLKAGTKIQFRPDASIFHDAKFDPKRIQERLKDIAFLCPGLTVEYKVDDAPVERYCYQGGVGDMLADIAAANNLSYYHDPIIIKNDIVEAAFAWTDADNRTDDWWHTYVNVTHTPENGTHLTGVQKAIKKVLMDQVEPKHGKIKADDLRYGVVGIIHAHVLKPEFMGQTKRSLRNRDVEEEIGKVIEAELRKFVAANPNVVKYIIDNAIALRDSRKKFREQQKAIRGTKVQKGAKGILPGKLCEAPECSPDQRELFIVEGDSAFGTVYEARVTLKGNVHFQEILPLRGKVMNAARKGGLDEVLKNQELTNITQAIGTGIGPAFNIERCRHAGVYLLMDADSDGKHIQALLLTFFASHMPELIEDGRLFVVQNPLFMGVTPTQRVYGNTVDEVKEQLKSTKNLRITRFKGLGESPSEDLQVYAMHPKSRSVMQVEWGGDDDQELVLKYMGLDTAARKELLDIVE